jgi:glycosyltransferase involved in cell wall biosynthesis
MRLLYVCENYWPMVGGAEHANQMICEGLASRGHRVTVITHRPAAAPASETLNGVKIVRVPCRESRYVFTVAALPAIFKHARTAELVHTSTFNAAPPSWLAARLTGRPVLCTVWETWIGRWRSCTGFSAAKATVHEMLERAVFALPYDRYVTISAATEDRLNELFPMKRLRTGCVYLGFDPSPWKMPVDREAVRAELGTASAFAIVGYGRPGISKGFRFLTGAFPKIKRAIPNATLLLILSEAPQHRRELAALKAHASSSIRFLPSQPLDRLVQIVKSADCIAVPSLTEGFGYTTLESCASGVPVVASRTTSIPEVVSGAFVYAEPGNSDSIADGVIAVHRGRYQRAPERSFPWAATLDGYEAVYRRLCERRT